MLTFDFITDKYRSNVSNFVLPMIHLIYLLVRLYLQSYKPFVLKYRPLSLLMQFNDVTKAILGTICSCTNDNHYQALRNDPDSKLWPKLTHVFPILISFYMQSLAG